MSAKEVKQKEAKQKKGQRKQKKKGLVVQPTLAYLVMVVVKLTHNQRLAAVIVADLINSRKVRVEGDYHGRRLIVG